MSREETQFKPGQSGNPNGRPVLPGNIKTMRQWNQIKFAEFLNEFVDMTQDQLASKLKSGTCTMLEDMIISVMLHAKKKGDHQKINFLLDRLIGKVPNEIDVTTKGEKLPSVMILPSNGRELSD